MTKILTLTAINFMSFESLKLDFRKYQGVTLINGFNGSGKSSIFEAIVWALFGKTIRKMASDDVISNSAKACEVWIEIETHNDTFDIKRRRNRGGGTTLSFSTVSEGTTTGKQALLEKLLGFDFQHFMSTVLFAGSTSSFCALTDSARKKVLEELLGFDTYARAYKKANSDVKRYEIQLNDIKRTISQKESGITTLDENIANYAEESDAFDFKWQRDYLDLLNDLGKLQEVEHGIVDDMLNAEIITADIRDNYIANVDKYNKKKDKLTRKLRQVSQELRDTIREIAALNERRRATKSDLDEKKTANESQEEGVCPFCGQYLPRTFEKRIFAIQPLVDELEKLESNYKSNIHKQSVLEREFKVVEAELGNLEEPEEPDYSTISRLSVELRNNKSSQNTMWYRLKKHVSDRDNRFLALIKNTEMKLEVLRKDISKLKVEAIEIEEYVFVTQYWTRAFHYNGIPSYLLDTLYPVINRCSTRHSDFLTDGDLIINFRNDDGNLGLDVSYTDGGHSYESVSTGEKNRVDLVVLLSIRDAIEFTYSSTFSQLFLDEIFNGLDETGVEAALNLLRRNFTGKQVFLITHDNTLKDLADNVINVTKTEKGSVID